MPGKSLYLAVQWCTVTRMGLRLTTDGHATLLIATCALDQTTKIIAYATCTDEKTSTITKVLTDVAREAKKVLMYRAEHRIPI